MSRGPKLQRISEHVWIFPFDSPKDRPNLGYILGDEAKLVEIREEMKVNPGKAKEFLSSDSSIRREYAGGVPLKVVPSDKIVVDDQTVDLGGVSVKLIKTESPHTDDALLVYVPGDRVLFVGDAQLGEFPSWRMDWDKLAALADKVRGLDVDVVVDGHWRPYTKEEYLAEIG